MLAVIDARHMEGDIRGIGSTVRNVVRALAVMDRENTYVLLVGDVTTVGRMGLPGNFSAVRAGGMIGLSDLVTVPRIINAIRPDVVWFPANNCSPFIRRDIKIISTIHDLMFYTEKYRPFTWQWLGSLYRRMFSSIAFARADAIHTVSHYNVGLLKKHSGRDGKDFFVSYPGINAGGGFDDGILEALGLQGRPFIYTISGSAPNKNMETVFRAFSLYRRRYDTEHCALVVTGIPGRARMKDLHASDDVLFTGYISGEQKNSLLSKCSLFIFLSREEGFGIPPAEAAFYHKKILLSDIGVFREVYPEVARFTSCDDVETIARDIDSAMKDEPTYDSRPLLGRLKWEGHAVALRSRMLELTKG